uniref:trypsin n=1 Tax=Anabas testudineus TaxID=64144 RepID=A0A3Q1KGC9_ANATE
MAISIVLLLVFVLNGADGSHIVGGRDAAPHSRPYMASLQVRGQHNCGGALVREDFVLTAAHCQIPVPYRVVLGADSLSGNEPTKQEFTSVKSFPHPNYDGHANDIMLLKLNRRAELNEAVQLISMKAGRLRTRSLCITVGWGDIGDNNTLPSTLQEVNVTTLPQETMVNVSVINLDVCKYKWPGLPANVICAGGYGTNKGFCQGDSGGPLVCNGIAVGVVSFNRHMNCNYPDVPNVYTNISKHLYWINYIVNSKQTPQI